MEDEHNKKSVPLMMTVALIIFCLCAPVCTLSPAEERSDAPLLSSAPVLDGSEVNLCAEPKRQADTLTPEISPKLPPGYLPPVVDWSSERVLLFGDSLSVGLGPHLERLFRDREVMAFKNIGVGGTMINHWTWPGSFTYARDLERELEVFKPTIVLVSLGTNDEAFRGTVDHRGRPIKKPYGPTFSVARLRAESLAEISKKLTHIPRHVWLIPPVTTRWRADITFRSNIKSWGGGYLEAEPFHLPKQSDRLHISDRGNRLWADKIIKYLEGDFSQ
jgi:lysophospholipase L1-like esterase